MSHRTLPTFACATVLLGALALAPGRARAGVFLEEELALRELAAPDLRVALAAAASDEAPAPEKAPAKEKAPAQQKAPAKEPSLDFDLLGEAPKAAAPAEDPSLKTRRKMLNLHQGLGLGLLGLQVASTVTGQLNYDDKFGTANTGKYKETHRIVTYTNIAAFAVVGGIALFAPREKNAPKRGYGRTTVHKIGMALATAGMITQGILGVQTANREGYLDQQKYARAHLAVGYATLAVMGIAVGVLVF